jgi:nitronate monooxygenase
MDGAGIRAVLALGAEAAQLGTAFVACPESSATDAHRAGLTGPGGLRTRMTNIISGRPARALANRFTAMESNLDGRLPPDYPIAYHAGKALDASARGQGEHGYGAHWAGQGARLARPLPAAELVATLARELEG